MDDFVRFATEQTPWAEGLSIEQLMRVKREIYQRQFDAGSVICHKGEPSTSWLGVVEGMVKLHNVAVDGRGTTYTVARGGWFGEGAVLKREPRPYEIAALSRTKMCFMPVETFDWLVRTSLPFCHYLIYQLNARLGQFVSLVEQHRFNESPERMVASGIAELFNPNFSMGTSAALRLSQEEIGRLCGLSRGIANRALHGLAKKGLLRMHYGVIHVDDVERLRQF